MPKREADTRKSWAAMDAQQIREYMAMAGAATETIMPADARFFLMVYGKNGLLAFVDNINPQAMPGLLRHVAAGIEQDNARKARMN